MYIYVASPYTHPDPVVMAERAHRAMDYTAGLIMEGKWAYSPIVHCHEMAIKFNFPVHHDFWMGFDAAMIAPCKEVHVLQLEGWEQSKGIEHELKFCSLIQKPVIMAYYNHGLGQYQTYKP